MAVARGDIAGIAVDIPSDTWWQAGKFDAVTDQVVLNNDNVRTRSCPWGAHDISDGVARKVRDVNLVTQVGVLLAQCAVRSGAAFLFAHLRGPRVPGSVSVWDLKEVAELFATPGAAKYIARSPMFRESGTSSKDRQRAITLLAYRCPKTLPDRPVEGGGCANNVSGVIARQILKGMVAAWDDRLKVPRGGEDIAEDWPRNAPPPPPAVEVDVKKKRRDLRFFRVREGCGRRA